MSQCRSTRSYSTHTWSSSSSSSSCPGWYPILFGAPGSSPPSRGYSSSASSCLSSTGTLYYRSITYRLTITEITWQRGVWFRQTGIVPYNRITNVDIAQGPLMRSFAFSSLHIQTAGYSGQARAEIVLNGIEDAGALQEKIMGFVRSARPVAVEGEPEMPPTAEGAILEELRAIRRLLEERMKN